MACDLRAPPRLAVPNPPLACCFHQELNLTPAEVESLLVDLILDQRLHGKIDQIDGFLLLQDSKQTSSSRKHDALERWSGSLRSLTSHMGDRVSS